MSRPSKIVLVQYCPISDVVHFEERKKARSWSEKKAFTRNHE
jgi:hypothetical protein